MTELKNIEKELQPIREELEAYRIQRYKKAQAGKILIALPILVFFASVAGLIFLMGDFLWGFLALMIASSYALYWAYNNAYYQHIEAYNKKFKSTLLKEVIKQVNPTMHYDPSAFVDKKDFYNSNLFDHKAYEGYTGEDYFEGKIKNMPVKFSEIDAKSVSGKNTITVFNGLFMVVDVDKSFKGSTFVLPENCDIWLNHVMDRFKDFSEKGELIFMENHPRFEKHFQVFTTSEKEAESILNKEMLNSILSIRKNFNAEVAISFQDEIGLVYIAISLGYRNVLEPDINKSILENDKVIERVYGELKACFDIVENLPLTFDD